MKKNILLLPIYFLILFNLGCKKTLTGPAQDVPGRRDYIWTVDTLYSPNNNLESIWGASPDDVWLAGPGGITNYDRLWHFDGSKWQPYQKQIIGTHPNCIFGLGKSDIWLGGNDGKIWHYDGNLWAQSFMYQTGSNYVDIIGISGKSPTNIYAVGVSKINNSFILHNDGQEWNEKYFTATNSQFLNLVQGDNGTFIANLKQNKNAGDTIVLCEYNNDQLKELYSKSVTEITYAGINKIGSEVFFLLGRDLNRYSNGKFNKVMTFSDPNFGYQVNGRSKKDFFVRMIDGLAHFNGENVEYLFHFSNEFTSIRKNPLIFDKEVFFAVNDYLNGYNLVLHGKLKD